MRRGMYLAEISWDCATTAVPSAPMLLTLERRVHETVGWRGEVQKNWVPWEREGVLHLSFSLEPHLVLRADLPKARRVALPLQLPLPHRYNTVTIPLQ